METEGMAVDFSYNTSITSDGGDVPLPMEAVWMWRVCPPVIILFGTFGSVMTIVVLHRMSVRQSDVPVYILMKALAVSDSVLLNNGLTRRWLRYGHNFDIRNVHESICKINRFVIYSFGMTSSFLLVAVTVQRMVSVIRPHRAKLLFTRRKSYIAVVLITTASHLVNIMLPFCFSLVSFPNTTHKQCYYVSKEAEDYFNHVHSWLDLSFTSLIPSCILILSNAVLIWKVRRSERSDLNITIPASAQVSARARNISSLTLTLIAVSVAFPLLTLPMCIFLVYSYSISGKDEFDSDLHPSHHVASTVVHLLYFSNSAVNFYLYCLSGSKFRKELKSLFSWEKSARDRRQISAPESRPCNCSADPRHSSSTVFCTKL